MTSAAPPVPATPRVISPSPTPSETSGKDGYFPPTTRSKATRQMGSVSEESPDDNLQEEEDRELAGARGRSRSPLYQRGVGGKMNGSTSTSTTTATGPTRRKKPDALVEPSTNGKPNGFLSPDSAYPHGFGSSYWRNLSRSPSPLGLIPIHREWRVFIHKHEIPRKALHVSIGFFGLWMYYSGLQPDQLHPYLLYALIPITAVDLIRFRWDAFNRVYIWVMGPLMRESEAHDRFNGVISYLAGLWITLRLCPKDVSIMSVLLLSWCDTAASTFGRLWGKYTPRIRRGKSLAGSLAAFAVGAVTAAAFWGMIAPGTSGTFDEGVNRFAFQGTLTLPAMVRDTLGLGLKQATISGTTALATISLMSGVIVSVSEAVDLWGLDDNLTIPVLCGIGLSAFLWACGGSGS